MKWGDLFLGLAAIVLASVLISKLADAVLKAFGL